MEAKVYDLGGTQLISLPKQFWFSDTEELFMNKIGENIMIAPTKKVADIMLEAARNIPQDFMIEEYPEEYFQTRAGEA